MILASVPGPWFVVIEGEDEDNLIELNIVKRKMSTCTDRIGVGKRLLQGAINPLDRNCKHNWGMTHFWGNPGMMSPCQITKIRGKWYRRKSCEHIYFNEDGSVTSTQGVRVGWNEA